ncbi:MAG: hypothetical protein OHK005_16570 [Candidatus Methylacidiphilales bacterium]
MSSVAVWNSAGVNTGGSEEFMNWNMVENEKPDNRNPEGLERGRNPWESAAMARVVFLDCRLGEGGYSLER